MSSIDTPENRTLALAGIFQATSLCKNLATYGRCDDDYFASSMASVLKIDADSVPDIFDGVKGVKHGLRVLNTQLAPANRERDLDLTRYSISLMQLGTNLERNDKAMRQLQRGLQDAASKLGPIVDDLSPDEESRQEITMDEASVINNLAELYRNNISHLSPRIMVSGSPEYLQNDNIASRIRVCLLAGLRSVILWRQCKGTRASLVFGRNKYLRIGESLMSTS